MGVLSQIEDRLTLRQQVGIATALLCVILVTAVAAGASYVGREQARRSVATEMAELARTVADRLDRGMSNRMEDAVLFSRLDPLRDVWIGDAATVRVTLEQLQETIGYATWIGFATPDGAVKAATGGLLEGRSVAEMPWFRHGMAGIVAEDVRESQILGPLLEPLPDGKPYRFVDVAAPVLGPDGRIAGVLGIYLDWRWAEQLLASTLAGLDPKSQTELWLLSRRGQVLVGPNYGHTPFPPPQRAAMNRAGSGSFNADSADGPVLTGFASTKGYRNFPGLGWTVVARRPTATAYAPARTVATTIFGLGLLIGGIGIAIASLVSNRVAQPIRRLTEEADRIGRDPGSVMLPHVQGSVEVAQLSSALRSLLRRLDLTEQAKAEVEERSAEEARKLNENIDALKELADTDPLTVLPNRRGMVRFGEDVVAGYNRDGRLFAVLVVDIDRFKAINDTYGHAVGDEVIRHVARLVEAAIRPTDRVARFGGEEFVAVLRDVHLIRAGEVAERLRQSIEGTPLRRAETEIASTVSVGVAIIAPGDRDVQDVIERADMALYDAKSSGRNRISIRTRPGLAAEQAA